MAVMDTESEKPASRRVRYPQGFRRDAAALVIDQHRTVADVAKELGVVDQTLGNWSRCFPLTNQTSSTNGACCSKPIFGHSSAQWRREELVRRTNIGSLITPRSRLTFGASAITCLIFTKSR